MEITTDPEFERDYFDSNIAGAVGYSVPATTWENVEYDRFRVMAVRYRNRHTDYFMMDDLGNFYFGGKTLIILDHGYLKARSGLIYPIRDGRIYFNEVLTPNVLAYKNGLKYQTKQLQELYTLLQVAGTFASILGMYAVGEETFKLSISAFGRTPAKLPGSPLPGIRARTTEEGGVPEPISDEAPTGRIGSGKRIAEVVGDFEIAGDKGLKGRTFERNINGLFAIKGRTTDVRAVSQLMRSFIEEARAAGATELRIRGNYVVNPNVLKVKRFVENLGGTVRTTGPDSIEFTIPVR